jgi:hypothetical protein
MILERNPIVPGECRGAPDARSYLFGTE